MVCLHTTESNLIRWNPDKGQVNLLHCYLGEQTAHLPADWPIVISWQPLFIYSLLQISKRVKTSFSRPVRCLYSDTYIYFARKKYKLSDSWNSFFRHHRHRSVPKLIYTQEFSDGLMLPNRDDTIDSLDDSLAPLASFDEAATSNGYVPSQFVLRGPRYYTRQRPMSELMSPMSEIQPSRSSIRNGLTPRPNSVLEVMEPLMISSVPPLSPPPDFHTGTGYLSTEYSFQI